MSIAASTSTLYVLLFFLAQKFDAHAINYTLTVMEFAHLSECPLINYDAKTDSLLLNCALKVAPPQLSSGFQLMRLSVDTGEMLMRYNWGNSSVKSNLAAMSIDLINNALYVVGTLDPPAGMGTTVNFDGVHLSVITAAGGVSNGFLTKINLESMIAEKTIIVLTPGPSPSYTVPTEVLASPFGNMVWVLGMAGPFSSFISSYDTTQNVLKSHVYQQTRAPRNTFYSALVTDSFIYTAVLNNSKPFVSVYTSNTLDLVRTFEIQPPMDSGQSVTTNRIQIVMSNERVLMVSAVFFNQILQDGDAVLLRINPDPQSMHVMSTNTFVIPSLQAPTALAQRSAIQGSQFITVGDCSNLASCPTPKVSMNSTFGPIKVLPFSS